VPPVYEIGTVAPEAVAALPPPDVPFELYDDAAVPVPPATHVVVVVVGALPLLALVFFFVVVDVVVLLAAVVVLAFDFLLFGFALDVGVVQSPLVAPLPVGPAAEPVADGVLLWV
jgi:hypothetical protein